MNLSTPALLSCAITLAVFVVMLAELVLSKKNERALRARGAIEPPGDPYVAMSWTYPIAFLAMGIEGALFGPQPGIITVVGAIVFSLGKAVKYWAIRSLGPFWSFRVLVVPDAALVTHGPYTYLRHPNYVGVMGELLGMALLVGASATGVIAVVAFALLLRRRMTVEDRALGRRVHGA